jgi:O-methyltransferase domain/Dimerisation domain
MSQPGIGNVAPNAALVQMAMSYARSRMVCAAARLGVADALENEERSVDQLAEVCQADADALYRLLRALAGIGITEETTPGRFRLTPLGQPLRKDDPQSAWAAVIFWGDLLADEWSLLTECVRAGKPAREVRPPGVLSRWSQEPEANAIFRAVMGTAPAQDYIPIAKAWDFSGAKVVADLGGGGGALIHAVLELYPQVRGMLVDLEPSIEAAGPRFATGEIGSRCELIAADLTQSVPPGADVYMLKHVLHGSDDAKAIGILRNCRAVMPENGALLIIEFILPPRVTRADLNLEIRLMSDLNMLAVTGGRERSEPEWKALLEAAGFRLAGVFPAGNEMGIVEARPV